MDPESQQPSNPMASLILKHWLEFRPKMCAGLKKKGLLLASVEAAAQLTGDAMGELLSQKIPYNQAWEMIREEWALLPDEESQPSLSFDPATLPETLAAGTGESPPETM
jgi:hypothetical protein